MYILVKQAQRLEPVILIISVSAFWFPSPVRDQWVWLIGLLLPVYIARYLLNGRLWTNTLFDELILGFMALCLINIFVAPFETRGVIMLFRPLLGAAFVLFCVEHSRRYGHMSRLLIVTTMLGILIGILSLTTVHWSEKSRILREIITILPNLQNLIWTLSHNPNEIAGVIVFLAPLMLALVLRWRWWAAGIAFGLLAFGLILGLSNSGIIGLIVGLIVVLVSRRWWPLVAALMFVGVLLVQVLIFLNPGLVVDAAISVSGRDDGRSLEHREALWSSGIAMISDYPVTGVGIAMYRNPQLRQLYPTPGFPDREAVHAHNEIINIGADLGIPGIIIFLSWYAMAAYMLFMIWRDGDARASGLAAGLAGGLLAHMVYGLSDAIPLWDRYAFVFWWMLGLVAAQYMLTQSTAPDEVEDPLR